MQEHVDDFRIVYVYQGEDGGGPLLKSMEEREPRVISMFYPNPLGVGRAFKEGFQALNGWCTHVLTMDADLNHEPEALPAFLAEAEKADVVVGSRYVTGGGWEELHLWKKVVSPLANRLVSSAFKIPVSDLSSGYRLYAREVVEAITPDLAFPGYEFYPESLILARRRGYTIAEVPITYRRRIHGKSKIRPLATGLGYAKLLLSLRRRGTGTRR